jgi:hypothetical protein
MNKALTNFSLIILSISLSLLIAEGICRSILEPIDYLMPEQVHDDILGHRLKPLSGGHDSWGYRNKIVPTAVNVVTIGDSQTYGLSATANNSWPAQFQQITGRETYNLSLGGYGPVQYLYLLQSRSFKIKPSLVIVGFYYGNDLWDAYETVYTNDNWQSLRRQGFALESNSRFETETLQKTIITEIKYWFSGNSVLYRLVLSSVIGEVVRRLENENTKDIVSFEDRDHEIYTEFTPSWRITGLNLDDPKVVEGLRISLELFDQMNELCRREGIEFLVALLPTKESVFAPYIKGHRTLPTYHLMDKLIKDERRVNDLVQAKFKEHNISYVDTIVSLRDAAGKEQIYPNNYDGHPNKNGYRIIAKAVEQRLKNSDF